MLQAEKALVEHGENARALVAKVSQIASSEKLTAESAAKLLSLIKQRCHDIEELRLELESEGATDEIYRLAIALSELWTQQQKDVSAKAAALSGRSWSKGYASRAPLLAPEG